MGLAVAEPGTALLARSEPAREELSTTARRAVVASAAAYGVLFATAATLHYFAFQAGRFDNGDMVQAIWATAHGHPLLVSDAGGHQLVRLGGHVDPLLVLLVPLWLVWPSPLLLLLLQALAVAAGALPVAWLARKHLGSDRAAAFFAVAYLLYPATQFNAFTAATGFHPVSLSIPLVLYAIWFLDEDRLGLFAVFGLLAATTKEEMALAVGCLGIWYAVRRGRPLVGLSAFAVGLGITLVNFLVVIPHYARSGQNPFAGRYLAVGGTPTGIARTAVTDPMAILHQVATLHKLAFLLLVLLPFLGLWLFEPLLLLGAVPDLAIDLLSSKPEQTTITYHYTAGIVPFVVAAVVLGAARWRERGPQIALFTLAVVAPLSILSPLILAGRDARLLSSPGLAAAKRHALDLVPAGASLTASNQLGGYLSTRPRISVFPYGRHGDWLIVDRHDPSYPSYTPYAADVRALAHDHRWRPVYSSHGILVFRRRGL